MRILVIVILFSTISYGQITNSVTKGNIQLINKLYQKNQMKISEEMRSKYPINNLGGIEYVSFLAKVNGTFNQSNFENRGINIGSRINDIVTVRYPLDELNSVLNETTFTYFKMAGKVKPLLEKVKIGTHVDSVWSGINLPQSYTGKNVIIGVQDWGFDFTSPMYYDTLLQNSRILACWDQFKNSGPSPSGYNYGTETVGFTDLQTEKTDTIGIYSHAYHGSHVAGIAGGSGGGTIHRGMAFESEYLFATLIIDESFAIDGWNWMYNYALSESKRLVINNSWGVYQLGALDGTDLLSQAVDGLVDNGVVLVTSAGNNGNSNFHIKKDFANDTIKTQIEMLVSVNPADVGQDVHMWGEAGNDFSSQLIVTDLSNNLLAQTPFYSVSTAATFLDTFIVASGTDTIFYNVSVDVAYPSNSRPYVRLQVMNYNGSYKVGLRSTAAAGTVHYFNLISFDNGAGNWGIPFSGIGAGSIGGNSEYAIGQPACATKSIAVGSYNSEYYNWNGSVLGGSVSQFSSLGPLIDGTLKPDITAPGGNVNSSINSYTDGIFTASDSVSFNSRMYYFAYLSGTSMAGPVVAGVSALILEANPYLTASEVKNIIIQTARTDSQTGTIPPHNTRWGWGKINAYVAVQMALTTLGVKENQIDPNWSIYPNPTNNQLNIEGLEGKITDISIINMMGQMVFKGNPELTIIDVQNLNAGVYFLRIIQDGKVEMRKFMRE